MQTKLYISRIMPQLGCFVEAYDLTEGAKKNVLLFKKRGSESRAWTVCLRAIWIELSRPFNETIIRRCHIHPPLL